jgi:hypothetical protein
MLKMEATGNLEAVVFIKLHDVLSCKTVSPNYICIGEDRQ